MSKKEQVDRTATTLESLLIIELLKGEVPQLEIRKFIGCDIHRISKLAKLLKTNKK